MSKLYHINSAYSLVKTLYGIEPPTEDFEDLSLNAWTLIGNRHTRLYRYIADTQHKEIDLPCNVDHIESVHIPIPDAQVTSSSDSFVGYDSVLTERYIDAWRFMDDPLNTPGKLIKYQEGGDKLYFNHDYKHVMIVYKGVIADEEDGLPLINDKEMNAIAAYVAYVYYFKEALITKNKDTFTLAQSLKEDWLRKCNAARIPEYVSQNDMDKILDIKSRWDRKMYSKSFKPVL